ncbi:permease [Methanocella sp. CWC-04]|uniref:Permease n=1 Tax=Methanooceanicella nereidis TaxID=2052831 RepID=A0AAP2RFU1_9EURY|nr:AEC family transporter [Methanocella sp. CWC-04]MCD1295805.1 permease [Methanocella sp. CWC-04]
MNILDVILPIFGMIIAGWLLKQTGILKDRVLKIINDYVYYVGITVITFVSLHNTSKDLLFYPDLYILNTVPLIIIMLIAYAVAKHWALEKRLFPVFIICAFYGNTGYIGFPLNIMVQGYDSLDLTAFISTIHTLIVMTIGVHILKKYSDDDAKNFKFYKLPVLWAAVLGLLLSWVEIPDLLMLPISLISQSVSPLALLATGAMVGCAGCRIQLKEIGVLSVIKLLLMPAIVLIMATMMGVSGTVYKTSLLEAATPVAVTNTILAAQFKHDYEFASNAVVISTGLFAISLALLLFII